MKLNQFLGQVDAYPKQKNISITQVLFIMSNIILKKFEHAMPSKSYIDLQLLWVYIHMQKIT